MNKTETNRKDDTRKFGLVEGVKQNGRILFIIAETLIGLTIPV
jgi:hypothetical protein